MNGMDKIIKSVTCGLLLMVVCGGCGTLVVSRVEPLSDDFIKPVVAVSSFENRSGFSGQWSIGTGMADLLVSELVASGHYQVVERTNLDKVIGELERQVDRHFRQEGRSEQGRLKNARYLIRGVINDFSQVGGSGLSLAFRKLFMGGKAYKARVALTLTVVDVQSGEIVDSVQCEGKASAGEAYVQASYKDISFGGDRFFKTPLGVSTCNALRRGIHGLVKTIPCEKWQPRIASILDNKHIIINGGADRKIRESGIYYISEVDQPVTDPVTGDVLDAIPGPAIGCLKVTTVEEKIAYAEAVDCDTSGMQRGMILTCEPRKRKK